MHWLLKQESGIPQPKKKIEQRRTDVVHITLQFREIQQK